MEFEFHVSGRIEEGRLRRALDAAAQVHTLARARMIPSHPLDVRYRWEIADGFDVDPLQVVDRTDAEALDRIRTTLQSGEVPLDRAPPFRMLLARGADGDVLLVNASHVASDGIGCLRFLRSVDRYCSGGSEAEQPVPARLPRTLVELQPQPTPASWSRRLGAMQSAHLDAWLAPPARVASDGGSDRPGYGIVHASLGRGLVARLARSRSRARGATINDMLVAGLMRTIDSWNREHGASCDRIAIMVPVNLRPVAWRREVFGNLSLFATVSTRPHDRSDASSLLGAVVAQTRSVKEDPAAAALVDLHRTAAWVPAAWKRPGPSLLAALSGDRFVPTAVLTNLGRLEEPFAFGAASAVGAWLSPPTRMPMGLAIGVVEQGGALHFSFRCRHALMSAASIERLSRLFFQVLEP